jgi:hypothetical protein
VVSVAAKSPLLVPSTKALLPLLKQGAATGLLLLRRSESQAAD